MREIGGYIELDKYNLPMLHEDAVALNTGRNCLAYLIESRNIQKIYLPYYICNAVTDTCKKLGVEIDYYHISDNFSIPHFDIENGAYFYVVNYFGQLSNNEILLLKDRYKNIIVDNAQAYFQLPVKEIDTIYTCRKFFGVTDGSFLYTNKKLKRKLEQDISHQRICFLYGRFEECGSEFYQDFLKNEEILSNLPLKQMSKLTNNLLHGIDYKFIKERRTKNYNYLFDALKKINKLRLKRIEGGFAYPLYMEDGNELRKKLIANKIYVSTLWPNVITDELKATLEYDMALNILPLPCDQRYDEEDMEYMIEIIKKEGWL